MLRDIDVLMRIKSFEKAGLEYFCFSTSETASELSEFRSRGETVLYISNRLVSLHRLPSMNDRECNFCSNSYDLYFAKAFFSELASLL